MGDVKEGGGVGVGNGEGDGGYGPSFLRVQRLHGWRHKFFFD